MRHRLSMTLDIESGCAIRLAMLSSAVGVGEGSLVRARDVMLSWKVER